MVWERTNRPLWLRCTVGIFVALIAAAIRLQFLEVLEFRVTFLTFYPAVAVAALYGGFSGGLPATVVSAVLANYYWMEPVHQFAITGFADLISMVIFLAGGTLISYLAEATYRAQARAHRAEEQSRLAAGREKAAVDLQQSESKYRELVQNANSAIIRWKRDGTIAFFNEYAQRFFGYSAEDVIGKSVNILVPEKESTGGDLTELIRDIVDHPERYANNVNENILRDGSRVWMAWTNRPIFDRDGQLLEILAVGSDITERKRVEEELRVNQSRLDLALKSAHMGVWHLDIAENRRSFDDQVCRLLGIDSAEFTGTAEEFYKTVHPDDRGIVEAAWARTSEQDVPYEVEYRVVWPDGSVHYVSARGKMARGDNGRPVRINGILWDITGRRQAEEEIYRQREWLRVTLSSIGDAVIATDASGLITFINPVAETLTGWRFEDADGLPVRKVFRIVNEKTHEPAADIAECVLREGCTVALANHTALVSRDGREIPIEDSAAPIRDDTGKISGVVLVFHDVTERRRAQEKLRESEQHYRSLFDNMLNGYAYCRMHFEHDRPVDFTYLDVNGAFETLTGLKDVAGRKVSEVIPGIAQSDPELLEIYGRVVLTGIPDRFERFVESLGMWFSVSAYSPRKEHFVAVFDVVTERKRTEEALRLSESRFRLLSETAGRLLASENPQAIVEKLCVQVMQHLDCHAFFNFLAEETIGKLHLNACAGIPADEARKIEWLDYGVAVCGCAARDGKRIVAEDIFNTPDVRTELVKSYGIQAYACHPLEARGKTIGTLSFGTKTRTSFSAEDLALMRTVADQVATAMEKLRLVDELRNSRDELEWRVRERTSQLERSNQALRDFTSIAAHDLQEPLRKINSFGNMIRQKHAGGLGTEGKDYLDRMLGATSRMQSLLASLLEYSRVTTKAEPPRRVNLTEIVREVLSDLEASIVQSGGEIQVEDLPAVEADPTQMRQLFQNLIGNALKFHKESQKPVIRVRGNSSGNREIAIMVEDNGIGFDEKYIDRIFSPFERLHGRNEYQGTGMGLAICKKIVERHGGSMTARSAPDKGSIFIINLPLEQPTGLPN